MHLDCKCKEHFVYIDTLKSYFPFNLEHTPFEFNINSIELSQEMVNLIHLENIIQNVFLLQCQINSVKEDEPVLIMWLQKNALWYFFELLKNTLVYLG
jgi:hypothetical protein